jgi:peptidoglycan/LPS O-acetylase OafA/YrhL
VTLVLLFHAWPALLPGGFVGVDVFFVISGFVVSRMVQRQLADGSFRVMTFFVRRVNRLAPALLLVLLTTLAFAVALLSPTLLAHVVAWAAAGLALVANLLSALQAGYFDQLAEVKPLLHLWSLAVEEQFYLVVPFAALLARRLPRATGWLAGLAALASFATCVWLTATAPQWAYALPVTRAWELLVGVLVAQRPGPLAQGTRWLREGLSLLGLAGVVGAAVFFDKTTPFPGAWALVPVLGSALLLSTGPDTLLGRAASARGPVALGLVSYPLYLWHWPVLTLGRLALEPEAHTVATPLLLAGSVVAAWATFRFVERPVRARQSRLVAFGLVATATALAALFTTLQLCLTPEDWAFMNPGAAKVARFERDYDYKTDARLGTCWLLDERGPEDESCVEVPADGRPLVMVWGDSHAARFTAGLRALRADRPVFRVGQRTRSSCPPLFGVGTNVCREANRLVFEELQRVRPEVLVLNARWRSYPNLTVLHESLQRLHAALPQAQLIVVGPAPEWRVTLPWALSLRVGVEAVPERLRPRDITAQQDFDRRVAEAVTSAGAAYVSALDALCTKQGDCLARLAAEPLMLTTWDYGHLTTPAAKAVARRVSLTWLGNGASESPP